MKVRCSVPCASASWKVASATRSDGGMVSTDVGASACSWRAAAATIILLTEPGSYMSLIVRLPVWPAAAAPGSEESNVGAVASASTCPVLGFSTITLPDSAFSACTWCAMACCAIHWMSRSRVSVTVRPAWASTVLSWLPGMTTPLLPTCTVDEPALPASTDCSAASMPATPVPSLCAKPRTSAASEPPG